MKKNQQAPYEMAGLFTLALRLVVGWTYFSAFWRRTALATKLDPDVAGYIGEKFNHFLPHALGIKPIIEYLVTHPDALWWNMVVFTIVEGVVGLFLILGLFTRLMSMGVFGLAMGILLGSGWIGTTCLDEWQIGVLGIAAGFTLFWSGSAKYSIDQWLLNKGHRLTHKPWFPWLGSGNLPIHQRLLPKLVLGGSLLIVLVTLFTNQYFHGGVWGDLHNLSVKPKVEINQVTFQNNSLSFEIYRTDGVDVYGSFLIGIALRNQQQETVFHLDGNALAQFPKDQIENYYVTKVKPGKHSLIIPLGARALLQINTPQLRLLEAGNYSLVLTDISGITWEYEGVMIN